MSPAPTSAEVLTLLAEWMDAKRDDEKRKAEELAKLPEPTLHGGFGIFSFNGDVPYNLHLNDRDDGDEIRDAVIPGVEQKLIRAQLALEMFVAGKVEEVLQSIINQSNERSRAPRPEHELYPERG